MGNPLVGMMNTNSLTANLQNSPIMRMAQLMKSGGNPNAMLQQMIGQNPQMAQFMQGVNGKTTTDLGSMINKMAEQKGVNLSEITKAIGVPEEAVKSLGLKM